MKLTVLGMYAPYPPAGGATSGYILSGGGTNILLDCGSGVISRLLSFLPIEDISAAVLSHLHGDHIADIEILRYMLRYRKRFGLGQRDTMTVYAPAEPQPEYALLRSVASFDVKPVSHAMKAQAGSMSLEFFAMQHAYPAYGVRITCEGKVFAFTGDTVMNENLAPLLSNADMALCDGSFVKADKTEESTHMSAEEAAALCRDSGVKRLIITHQLSHYKDMAVNLAEAKAVFAAAQAAEEMKTYEF